MTHTNLRQIIYELECSHLKPNVRTSEKELSKIIADDYFEIGSSGNIFYRKDYASDKLSPDQFILSDFEMEILSEDCVLTTFQIYNETKLMKTLRSSIWRKRSGEWKLFFHQGTKASD
ncbi:nuclear transport factor 2 family protein [Chengkuizengella axinellae]|uniref:DUF4440 domain-containing protein n=1 Tax=Chengkuizengella axinellae TaxID=3064388 RepID=A0ABT9J6C2_9BACL|nr:DUF4440 domain-containing protein [Chengkuizengella sp. 2205SS18-9]MDP5277177.1 DUF4440 domain-containing protein [Chengkuizengella sp. 2205SS18-9]